ncbi:MAG TPA: DUF3048 domain-containing protein [Anaerolineae bacterium]|nr:DUF3048 domain-containing protein [Anaerolineae bacterium]
MLTSRRAIGLAIAGSLGCLTILLSGCQNSPGAAQASDPTRAPTHTPLPQILISPTPARPTLPPVTPTPTADTRLITTFAPDVNPLTGEQVSDPAVLQRRPLAIKVGNSNETGVRPQSGVSLADLVFEHETEGRISRWTAIFLTNTPARVGSNRSCRIIDADLPAMYKSLLACSGFHPGTRMFYIELTEFHTEHRVLSPDFGDGSPMFFRTDAPGWHNMFVDPAAIWEEADERGINQPQALGGMVFSTAPLEAGEPATQAIIPYRDDAEWRYNPTSTTCSSRAGCYLRWSGGVAHTDALNGQQLSAANVVIVYVNHVQDVRYREDVSPGSYSIQIQIWNDPSNPELPGGRALILRDGQVFEGKWSRPGRFAMLAFIDAAGDPIPLKPGITWVQLVRLDANVQIQP